MPVNTTSNTVQYTGNGVQTTFPFTFPISVKGDLVVKERVTATGVTTLQALTTHYTVTKSGANFDDGGNVEMVAAPAATDTLIINRATTQTQGTDLIYGGAHDSEAYENMVDKNTRMIQDLQAQVDRCIKIPGTDAIGLNTELENSIERASNYIGLDASGGVISAATFAAYGAASGYIQTLLDDADAVTARATLEAMKYLRDTGIHIGNDTRNASGNQVITGVGFLPSVIIFLAVDDTGANMNWSAGFNYASGASCINARSGGTVIQVSTTRSMYIYRGAGNRIDAFVSAFGADGFTLDWALTGACVVDFVYLALP